jgi:hypothetical protein
MVQVIEHLPSKYEFKLQYCQKRKKRKDGRIEKEIEPLCILGSSIHYVSSARTSYNKRKLCLGKQFI